MILFVVFSVLGLGFEKQNKSTKRVQISLDTFRKAFKNRLSLLDFDVSV